MDEFHKPVLLKEAIDFLQVKPGGVYVDATVGGGGYAVEILKRGGELIGIDCDPEAIEEAWKNIENLKGQISSGEYHYQLFCDNFKNLKDIVEQTKLSHFAPTSPRFRGASWDFEKVDGVIFDLGVSRHQLKTKNRGFSFLENAPLDMRMDPRLKVTAGDLVNALTEKELDVLFRKFGEEQHARPIARAIIRARRIKKIETTGQLAWLVNDIYQKNHLKTKIHPATKIFQALRMAVNSELANLKTGLDASFSILGRGKRLVVLSFHSLEDRLVKDFLRQQQGVNKLEILTKKPIVPSAFEVEQNPSSHSAKLRAAEKR